MCNGRRGEEQVPLQNRRMIQAAVVAAAQNGGSICLRDLVNPSAINRGVTSVPSCGTEVVVHVEAWEEVEREDPLELHDAVVVDGRSSSVRWHQDGQLLLAESADKISLIWSRGEKESDRRMKPERYGWTTCAYRLECSEHDKSNLRPSWQTSMQ